MAKKGSSAPEPVSPQVIAGQQGALNEATARLQHKLNSTDVISPYGSVTYQDLGGDKWQQTINLTPEQQQLLEQQQRVGSGMNALAEAQLGRLDSLLSEPVSFTDTAPPLTTDFGADRQRVEDALYNRATSRLDPMWGDRENALMAQLANQGIVPGTEAYSNAMREFQLGRNDAYENAVNQSIAAGGAEESRLFGLSTAARQQAIQESLTARNQPINEITALLSGGQVTMPQFSAPPQTAVQPVDISGPYAQQYQAQLANYAAGQNRNAGLMGGVFGLGSAALGGWASGGF